ncbi:MAG: cation transporter [Bacteroidetes bacterium]|nr:cation transporter [Bacteroidota bacterium]
MTHTYQVTGMTCENCETKVKSSLLTLPDVTAVEISKENGTATISMDKHIAISDLQKTLGGVDGKYQIKPMHHSETAEQAKSWFSTYKPILLIFFYITIVTLLIQTTNHHPNVMQWMQHFMAGFFLTFSFFKMLDLSGFADSYATYDIVAKRFKAWGFIYAFIELGLGIAYTINFQPFATNLVTVVVMGISTIGVLQSVLNKQKIQCACLGAVFNLPMSTVTIIEDLLMVSMAGITLITI